MSRLEVWNLGYSVPTMIHTGTLTFKDADEEQHADSNSTRFIKGLAEFKLQLKSFLPLSEESPFNKNSVQFSRSVVSDSLQTHGPRHTRPRCLSPTSRVYPNSCLLCHPTTQPSHPLSSPSPPAFNLSQHQGLSNESALLIRWPKY